MKVICECGVNWCDLDEAFLMIKKSKEAGCWAAKFQIYNDEIIKDSKDYKFLKSIMITEPEAILLVQYGHMIGQKIFFTPMYDCIDWLDTLVDYYKIRFKDRYNLDLINKIKETKKQYFISMNLEDNPKFGYGYKQRKVLFCQPYYPCGIGDYVFNSSIIFDGISDHTKDLQLLKIALDTHNINPFEYFEKHVYLEGTNPIEKDWSCMFAELKEVLKDTD